MTKNFSAYLPQDRLRTLVKDEFLPNTAHGSALFADISGFTALTEKLNRELGARRGAEEVTRQINAVFESIVEKIQQYGGSVIGFAGDAMTCWFGENAESRMMDDEFISASAVSCAFELQAAMQAFPELALKVSIASGAARRMMVGDEAIQVFDSLGGETITRMAVGEHLAGRGEILVDEESARGINIREWRVDVETGWKFGVAESAPRVARSESAPLVDIPEEKIRAWIHPLLRKSESAFAAEFRTITAMFLRFTGIDYDSESAPALLNEYIRWAQNVVARYEGFLRAPIIGDKGSYLLIVFGAPVAHEDDMRRALRTALALHESPFEFITTQIGIAAGVVWAGQYGGANRKSYDFIGDDVNLAARLMQAAAPHEILVSGRVQAKLANTFSFGAERSLQVKGKTEAAVAFALQGETEQRGIHLLEPAYPLPMVGREREMKIIAGKLELAAAGKAQIIGVTAEAGMGKSRLAAEMIHLAHERGFKGYGGACQADGINTPYLAWKPIWGDFFNTSPNMPAQKQIRALQAKIKKLAPERVSALPVLGNLLHLEIPDNDFTKPLDPQTRQNVLRALLEDCLRAAAKESPLLIVIEDLHWVDALSHDLLENLALALTDSRICFVMMYRPPQIARIAAPRLEALPNFTKIELSEFNTAEVEQAIRAKLRALYPHGTQDAALTSALVQKMTTRSQGNPFFLEELLNYLHDQRIDPRDSAAFEKLELPDSLHALILSRIDQLNEHEKITLRVASIIGRLFRAAWLVGYYTELGSLPMAQTNLEQLAKLDITPQDSPEPELAYLFKHIITHEVTYESLPYATRSHLHERLAEYLEKQITDGALTESSMLDTLAFHYSHTENQSRQRYYLRKAAQAAMNVSAFTTAMEYTSHLIALTSKDDPEYSSLLLQLAEAYYSLSNYDMARSIVQEVRAAAKTDSDRVAASIFLGEIHSEVGDYPAARDILFESMPLARACNNPLILSRALYASGDTAWRMGNLDEARVLLEESLSLARTSGDISRELYALNRLGTMCFQIDLDESERFLREGYTRALEVGNRERISSTIGNLGTVFLERGDFFTARGYYQQAVQLSIELGAQFSIAMWTASVAASETRLGRLEEAAAQQRKAFALAVRSGATQLVILLVAVFADLAYAKGEFERALNLLGLARAHPSCSSYYHQRINLSLKEWAFAPAMVESGLAKGAAMDWDTTIQELLKA